MRKSEYKKPEAGTTVSESLSIYLDVFNERKIFALVATVCHPIPEPWGKIVDKFAVCSRCLYRLDD